MAFAPGVLCGTNAPTAGRTTVTGKSPATNLFAKANMGGHWGPELKYAGYDALVLHGQSPSWINLVITNTRILFEPADRYLGLSVKETTERIAEEDVYKRQVPSISAREISFPSLSVPMGSLRETSPADFFSARRLIRISFSMHRAA